MKKLTAIITLCFISFLYCPNPDHYEAYEANPGAYNQPSQITVDYFDLQNAALVSNQQAFNQILNIRFARFRNDNWIEQRVLDTLLNDMGHDQIVVQCIEQARIRLRCCRG